MYDLNSALIAGILFVSMGLAIELGYRLGLRGQSETSDSAKTQVNAIQASLLGILALLLGFTFSLSLQRYDSRSQAVVHEANAIGTTYLRAQLLEPGVRKDVVPLLRHYLDLRISSGHVNLADDAERVALVDSARRVQDTLWSHALRAAELDDREVTSGLFIESLNELIDSLEVRDAALNRHVPEVVLFLLYGTFLMTGTIVGYASGVTSHRASYITYIMVSLIVLLVFVIIDLDRPRRGLIEVSQKSMIALQESMAGTPAAAVD